MNYDENCIFCKIGRHEIPSAIVFEDAEILAFLDINPVSKGHTLIITKEHFANLTEVPNNLVNKAFNVAKTIAQTQLSTLGAIGVNILSNIKEGAGQTVMHFHVHVIPRYDDSDGIALDFSPKAIGTYNLPILATTIKDNL